LTRDGRVQFSSLNGIEKPARCKLPLPRIGGQVLAEITLLGSGLQAVVRKIQKYDLNFVKAIDRRFTATLKTHVATVAVNFTKQKI